MQIRDMNFSRYNINGLLAYQQKLLIILQKIENLKVIDLLAESSRINQ